MSRTWKWIIGIGLTLSVIALAVLPFILRIGMRAVPVIQQGARAGRQFPGKVPEFGKVGMPAMRGGFPLMTGLHNVLLPLLVVALVLFVGYLIGSARKPAVAAAPVAPAPAVQAQTVEKGEITCENCGKGIQQEWTHCPFCGNKRA